MVVFCESCGGEISDTVQTCPHCHQTVTIPGPSGTATEVADSGAVAPDASAFCTNCRKRVPPGMLLCTDCASQSAPDSVEALPLVTRTSGVTAREIPTNLAVPTDPVSSTAAASTQEPTMLRPTEQSYSTASARTQGGAAAVAALGLPEISPAMRIGARDGAMTVVGLYLASLIVSLVALPFLHGVTAVEAFRGAGWLTGLTFRGHLIATGSVGGSSNGAIAVYFQPGLLFAAAMTAISYLTIKAERLQSTLDLRSLMLSSAATGVGTGAAALIISLVTGGTIGSSSDGSTASIHVNPISAFIGGLVFATAASAITRLVLTWHQPVVSERMHKIVELIAPEARILGEFTLIGSAMALVALVMELIFGGASLAAWLIALLDLPFLLLDVLLLSMGVPLSSSGSFSVLGIFGGGGSAQVGIFSGGLPGYFGLLILIPIISIVVVGIRATVVEPLAPRIRWDRVARMGALGAAGAWIVSYITSIVAGASAGASVISGSGTVRIGLAVFASVLAGGIVAGGLCVVGFYLARLLGTRAPQAVAWVSLTGGGALHPDWAEALGDVGLAQVRRPAVADAMASGIGGGGAADPAVRAAEGPPSAADTPRREPSAPRQRHPFVLTRRVKVALYALGTVVVVVAAGIITLKVIGSSQTPTSVATSYMQALASGNATSALSNTDGQWSGPWLTSAALQTQESAGSITHIQVGTATISGSQATVPVSFWVGTTPVSGSISLRSDGSKDLFFTRWVVANPVALLSVSGAGVDVDRMPSLKHGEMLVFPGDLVFKTIGGGSPYVQTVLSRGRQEIVTPGQSVQVPTRSQLTSAGETAVINALDQSLQQCLASTSFTPPNCPFADPNAANSGNAQVSGVQWTVSEMPSLENTSLSLNPNGKVTAQASYGAIYVSCSYNYVDPVFGPQSANDQEIAMMTTASVSFSSGQPVVTFQNFQ